MTNLHTGPQGRLIILLGQTGAGKSELVKYAVETLGVQELKRVSTRPLRSDAEKKSNGIDIVTEDYFTQRATEKLIIGSHEYYGFKYGLDLTDAFQARNSGGVYIFETCDPVTAVNLRNELGGFAELTLLSTTPHLIASGLEKRTDELIVNGSNLHVENTLARMANIARDYQIMLGYSKFADHILSGGYTSNTKGICRIITQPTKQ